MIDLLFSTYNRRYFAEASIQALIANTNWDLVSSLCLYDDGSTDGTENLYYAIGEDGPKVGCDARRRIGQVPITFRVPVESRWGGPVNILNYQLALSKYDLDYSGVKIVAKIDSDVIVPPGWLDCAFRVMQENPQLDILGLEPPSSSITINLANAQNGYAKTDAIGGLGLIRASVFPDRTADYPKATGTRGGFTDWQLRNRQLEIGWLAPPLNLFLLDRLPMEPWKSLSEEYVTKGWQRPWRDYTTADQHLWSWWLR